jgi:hypothetical protein
MTPWRFRRSGQDLIARFPNERPENPIPLLSHDATSVFCVFIGPKLASFIRSQVCWTEPRLGKGIFFRCPEPRVDSFSRPMRHLISTHHLGTGQKRFVSRAARHWPADRKGAP